MTGYCDFHGDISSIRSRKLTGTPCNTWWRKMVGFTLCYCNWKHLLMRRMWWGKERIIKNITWFVYLRKRESGVDIVMVWWDEENSSRITWWGRNRVFRLTFVKLFVKLSNIYLILIYYMNELMYLLCNSFGF